jgi:hypothetical protein
VNPGGYAAQGEGWRLAWQAGRQPFAVLIGGRDWAAELTGAEALQFRQGIERLLDQFAALADQLLAEEAIGLELERGPWWLSLEGDRRQWALRFVLSPDPGQRAIEGGWEAAASTPFVAALRHLPLQDQPITEP